jgi:hypothetical protein
MLAASACSIQESVSWPVLSIACCFPAPWLRPRQMQWQSGSHALQHFAWHPIMVCGNSFPLPEASQQASPGAVSGDSAETRGQRNAAKRLSVKPRVLSPAPAV